MPSVSGYTPTIIPQISRDRLHSIPFINAHTPTHGIPSIGMPIVSTLVPTTDFSFLGGSTPSFHLESGSILTSDIYIGVSVVQNMVFHYGSNVPPPQPRPILNLHLTLVMFLGVTMHLRDIIF